MPFSPIPETKVEVTLFHPRQDNWDSHFHVDTESGSILGITLIGRATVARLEMNSEAQIAARRQWMRLDLFP